MQEAEAGQKTSAVRPTILFNWIFQTALQAEKKTDSTIKLWAKQGLRI